TRAHFGLASLSIDEEDHHGNLRNVLEDDGEPESVLDRIRRVVVPKGAPDRRGIVVDRQVREVLVLTGPGGRVVTHRLLDLDRLGLLLLRGGLGFFLWRGFGLLRLLRLGRDRKSVV